MQHTSRYTKNGYTGPYFPEPYENLESPHSTWWLQLSQALGNRDIGYPGGVDHQKEPTEKVQSFGGMSAEITKLRSATVSNIVQCFRYYLEFPRNVRCSVHSYKFISDEFRNHLRACCDAWKHGGDDAFCEAWDRGEYLLPGQLNGQPTIDFLGLQVQEELLAPSQSSQTLSREGANF